MLDWEQRLAALWATFDDYEAETFLTEMRQLVSERPADNPVALFELAGACDSIGREAEAVDLYRRALAHSLAGVRRRRAVIQLASTLRNVGQAGEGAALLRAERQRSSDEMDDAISAVLGLTLVDSGREREAVGVLLAALAPHLPLYQRSMANYARMLIEESAG